MADTTARDMAYFADGYGRDADRTDPRLSPAAATDLHVFAGQVHPFAADGVRHR